METVAQAIKRIITEKGLVQRAVAERAGFTEQQLSYMLNNRQRILADYMPRLSSALGVPVSVIFEKHTEKAAP